MNITFIGGGNMASAMIGGLIRQGWTPDAIQAVEISAPAREALATKLQVKTHTALAPDAVKAECIVLAVKPQQVRDVAHDLAPHLTSQLIVSIAAGIRLADLRRWLRGYPRLVRVMPNTPALAGAGIAALHARPEVSAQERASAERLLASVGTTLWLEHEEEMDAVTAVSGSGPAYVFYFMEALEEAAQALGLSAERSRLLARETFSGAAKLVSQTDEGPKVLRERVTSKGGTTERALESLDRDRVKDAILRAVRSAAQRSRELGEALGKD